MIPLYYKTVVFCVKFKGKFKVTNSKEPNLILKIPEDYLFALTAIANERETEPENLVQSIVKDYIEDENLKPPMVDFIAAQLRSVQTKFNKEKVIHISIYGPFAHGTATRRSIINLLFDIEWDFPLAVDIGDRIMKITKDQLGKKFKIFPEFKYKSGPEVSDLILKDAVKIF